MTDIDQLSRTVKDLEYRVRALERQFEPRKGVMKVNIFGSDAHYAPAQWCSCGRDICRAPDCPSHAKQDPLGR